MMKEQLDSIEVKEELCRMLKELDEYLGRHEIQYSIMSGTMLGAVRHGGFIPWDDDIDIAILRKDYDRLIEILRKINGLVRNWRYLAMKLIRPTCHS